MRPESPIFIPKTKLESIQERQTDTQLQLDLQGLVFFVFSAAPGASDARGAGDSHCHCEEMSGLTPTAA